MTADELLENWEQVAERVAAQRDDAQAATMTQLVTRLEADSSLTPAQEQNLVAYIAVLPRDLRFGLVKSLLRLPRVADILSRDEYDAVVFDAIAEISREAS